MPTAQEGKKTPVQDVAVLSLGTGPTPVGKRRIVPPEALCAKEAAVRSQTETHGPQAEPDRLKTMGVMIPAGNVLTLS